MKWFCIVSLLLLANQSFAQHSQRAYIVLADSLYKNRNYKDAAYYYERAIKNAKEPGNIMLKVAHALTAMNSVNEAEAWYEKARANNASFATQDTYFYVKELMMLNRKIDAQIVLVEFLKKDPEDRYARQLLEDLQNSGKYFVDSSNYRITPLSINTPASEFAPAYYKDGLVFTSARSQFIPKKKYHWDNSPFLNLYYTSKSDGQHFQKPNLFDKYINTRLHDGPVSFYSNYERMILNRNVETRMELSSDVYISHLTLFDVDLNPEKKNQELLPLPFERGPYSFAHPNVSEDGNTLYFVSDKPGGYGGTDIYISFRQNEGWSQPFNLGPLINSPENETFPFFLDNTLYFSSDGHGGLGGMDLFKSTSTANGFTPPINLGSPINSNLDDFSLITKDHKTGYFASSRQGDDNLFEFNKHPRNIKMLARLCDGVTNASLPEVSVQLLRNIEGDLFLTSGRGGTISFELPNESPYILIAEKEGKTGVLSGLAVRDQDFEHIIHQIPIYGDSTSVTCVVNLKSESGKPQNALSAVITDQATGEKTKLTVTQSLLTFQGKKGHQYHVEVQNELGNTIAQDVDIALGDSKVKTWSMSFKDAPELITIAVRVLEERTQAPVNGSMVQITTLAAPDQEIVTDENGLAEFSLLPNAAYTVIALKDSLAGMIYGFADKASDKKSITHTIYLKGEKIPPSQALAVIMNSKGEILQNAKATVTDQVTGLKIPIKIENGLLYFVGDPGKTYMIEVAQEGYGIAGEKITFSENNKDIRKLSIVLPEIKTVMHPIAARVVKEEDNSSIAGAAVEVVTFSLPELNLVSNEEGIVEFSVPNGEAYMAIATKNDNRGVYMGIADSASIKPVVIHRIPVSSAGTDILISGKVTDIHGVAIANSIVEVTDSKTGKMMPGEIVNGMLSFHGKRGGEYDITVSAENHATLQKKITPDSTKSFYAIPNITLNKKIPVTAKIGDRKGGILKDARVRVVDELTKEEVDVKLEEGNLTFLSEQGKSYSITVEHPDYKTVEDRVIVPGLADEVKTFYISLDKKVGHPLSNLIKARILMLADSSDVPGAEVKVLSFSTDDINLVSDQNGRVEFSIPDSSAFIILGSKSGEYFGEYTGISEKGEQNNPVVHSVFLKNQVGVPVLSFLSDETGRPLSDAKVVVTDNKTGQPVEAKIEHGIMIFNGNKGGDYSVEVIADGYENQTSQIKIDQNASSAQLLEIKVSSKAKQQLSNLIKARVLMLADSSAVPGAEVKVISFSTDDINLVSDQNGRVEFSIPDSSAFIILGSKSGEYFGEYTGISEKGGQNNPVVHSVFLKSQAGVPVLSFLSDETGHPLSDAKVVVTDKKTGQPVAAKVEYGIVSFNGNKGGDYSMEVIADGYENQTAQIKIDKNASSVRPLEIKVFSKAKQQLSHLIKARVLMLADSSAVPGAEVKVISFAADDINLVSDQNGRVEFSIPDSSAFIILGSKSGEYFGEYTGISEKGGQNNPVVHSVSLKSQAGVPVLSFLSDETGHPLSDAKVVVTDKKTGQPVAAKVEYGIVSFNGNKGGDYSMEVIADGYENQTAQIKIDKNASSVRPLEIKVSSKAKQQLSNLIKARVLMLADSSAVPGAEVKVISFAADDINLVSDQNGRVEFSIPDSSAFIILGSKSGEYFGEYTGISEKEEQNNPVVHSVFLKSQTGVPVLSFLSDETGHPLSNAKVVVTDKKTGQPVAAKVEYGIVSFNGNKGGDYSMEVIADGYENQTAQIKIDKNASSVRPLEIKVSSKAKQQLSNLIKARVLMLADSSAVPGAEVKVISFSTDDINLVSDQNGRVEFSIPDSSAFIILGSKSGEYFGEYTGISEKGGQNNPVVHSVFLKSQAGVPVLSFLSDETGHPLSDAKVVVTDKKTGQPVEAKIEHGIMIFNGNKGGDYSVEVIADGYENQTTQIKIDQSASSAQLLEITVSSKKLLAVPLGSTLVVVNNENPRLYITSQNSHEEIIEENGMLYIQNKEGKTLIGNGSLRALIENPSRRITLTKEQLVNLENIYFDFNSSLLDQTDYQVLERVKQLFIRYPILNLHVSAHADARGSINYNKGLTRRRANAIRRYLVRQGIPSRHISTRAYGKALPAVTCDTKECTELQHQRNRRAEFDLNAKRRSLTQTVIKQQNIIPDKVTSTSYDDFIAKYGDRSMDGVAFKICIGAYRLNPDLKFQELNDLGSVTRQLKGGINFYYLESFQTLNAAESTRKKIIERGIGDAYVSYFYKQKRISFTQLVYLNSSRPVK